MPEDKPVGKQYRGEIAPAYRTAGDVLAEQAAQLPFKKEGAVSIETYFASRGIKDPVMQASMKAFTVVRTATLDDWDGIFEAH